MKKEDFNLLLTDLYQAYNPEFVPHVQKLVEKYAGQEFAAVQMVFIKYNRKTAYYYDPEKDKDEYILNLIKEYSSGNRILKDFKLTNETAKLKEQEEIKIIDKSKELEETVTKTIEELQKNFSGTEKQLISTYEKQIEELNNKLSQVKPVKLSPYDGLEVKIICNYTEQEVRLPNRDSILGMGVGSRIITKTKDGSKLIGLKVVDIMYDCVSDFDDKPIIEIIIDKE